MSIIDVILVHCHQSKFDFDWKPVPKKNWPHMLRKPENSHVLVEV